MLLSVWDARSAWAAPAGPEGADVVEPGPGPAAVADPTTVEPVAGANVSPPRMQSAKLSYPPGASGTARVLLELVIDRDGSVRSAHVAFGLEPFASAAVAAARAFRFEPARRDGQPVPARIRIELEYTPPPSVPVPAPAAVPAAPPPGKVLRVQVLGEVTPGAVGLSSGEARILPGAFGDPFRALAVLPGIAPLVTGLPVFYVRGSPPGNLGFLVDGVRVPLLFHAFLGPAVIHPRLLERTELYAGGYPASLGRFAGGVVTADLSEPRGELNGEWSVRLLDAGLFLDVPFAGGKGNLIAAGRYSYTALLISLLSDAKLDYWDYQLLASYDLSPRDRLSVFSFGAYDFLGGGAPEPMQESTVGDGDSALLFHRLDLRYDHRYSEQTRLRAAATLGVDETRGAQGRVRDRLGAARLELSSRLGESTRLRAGADLAADTYDLRLDPNTEHGPAVAELFPGRTDHVVGGYADLRLELAPGVTVTPGVRVDRYSSQGRSALGVSPRLSASFRIARDVSIEHAIGVADQPPNFVPGVPGVAVAGLPGGLQRSLQSSAGVRAELPASFQGRATLFQNTFLQLTDPVGQTQDFKLDADEARIRSLGHAYGLELLLQRALTRRWGALLSYTLSRSTRSHDRVHTLSGYDRTQVLNTGGSYELGAHFLASGQAVLYSGVPGRRNLGQRRVFDRSRAPPFFRIDLRLEKRFLLAGGAYWSVVAELMNATLSREVLRRPCEPTCKNTYVGPIFLPSLGVSGQF
ncbi:MAG: TonB-dependent receptor [Deltaproteobacteria bacterium]